MEEKNYYSLLGVSSDADIQEIRQAYRRLARTCHPDLNPDDRQAEARFKQLSHAVKVLCDPLSRASYDYAAGFTAPAELAIGRWEAFGYDATTYLTVTPREAAVGTVKALGFTAADGQPYILVVDVPPGTWAGRQLRLKGAGGPARSGTGRGDLIVIVQIAEGMDYLSEDTTASPIVGLIVAMIVSLLCLGMVIILGFRLYLSYAI